MTVELYPVPEFQIFRKNILHLWKERKYVVRIEAKVLTHLTTHDVIATVGKKMVLHPPIPLLPLITSGLRTPLCVCNKAFLINLSSFFIHFTGNKSISRYKNYTDQKFHNF